MQIYTTFLSKAGVFVNVLISNLQKKEPLSCLLDQLFGDVLGVKLGPELDQQRVVPLHILSSHLIYLFFLQAEG